MLSRKQHSTTYRKLVGKMVSKVKIKNWEKCPFKKDSDGSFSSNFQKIWYSEEDKKKAVIDVWGAELFVAVIIEAVEEDEIICVYTDHYSDIDWLCDFKVYNKVTWWLQYGFAKLHYFSMDTGEVGVKRLYFDKQLYLDKYLEENGTPKTRAGKVVTKEML